MSFLIDDRYVINKIPEYANWDMFLMGREGDGYDFWIMPVCVCCSPVYYGYQCCKGGCCNLTSVQSELNTIQRLLAFIPVGCIFCTKVWYRDCSACCASVGHDNEVRFRYHALRRQARRNLYNQAIQDVELNNNNIIFHPRP